MIVQDIAYIQIEETDTYINGVASKKQILNLNLDSKVDKESSLILYDGKNIDLTKETISIDVQKEGITQLVYILKDVDGYRLEEGEKTIVLDTQEPQIQFSCPSPYYFDQKASIHVSIQELNPDWIEVYLDNELIEVSDYEFDVDITSQNQKLKVFCQDLAGHKTIQEVDLVQVMYPTLETNTDCIYWSKNHFTLPISKVTNQPFDLDIYLDGEYYYSLPIENENKISLEFLKNGTYSFQIRNREDSSFRKDIPTKVIFSDVEPILQIKPSQTVSNDQSVIQIFHNVEWMDDGYYEIEYKGIRQKYKLDEICNLKGFDNEDITYKVRAYIRDLFGREITDEIWVKIDKRPPITNLYVNSSLYTKRMSISSYPEFKYVVDDLKAVMRIEYYLNGKRMDENPYGIYKKMKRNDVLKIMTYTMDSLENEERKEYEFIFIPEEQKELIQEIIYPKEQVQVRRVWVKNTNDTLTLKENKKKSYTKKHKMHYVRKKNIVQIWLEKNEHLIYVKVNDEKVPIEKNKLKQDFVKIKLHEVSNHIEIKMKDKNGVEKIIRRQEKMKKISWWQRIVQFFKRLWQ